MKPSIFFMLVIMLIGCSQQPFKQLKENPRVAFLKDQAQLVDLTVEYFYEVDSFFSLMKDIQDGILTTSDLPEALFYFEDPLGVDTGSFLDNTYFKCIQVMDMPEFEIDSGEKVPVYLAHYSNYQIDMTIAVIWEETKPLKGQKLNVDFLAYVDADTFENQNNEERTRVIFARPFWAGSNGHTYD